MSKTNFKFDIPTKGTKIYNKLEKRFNKINSIVKTDTDKEVKENIINVIKSQKQLYKDIIQQNLTSNVPDIKDSDKNKYVFFGMLEHSGFPRLKDNTDTKKKNKIDDYICKVPKGAIVMDLIDTGGVTLVNKMYEDMLFFNKLDIFKVLQGNLNVIDKNDSNSRKLNKYISKNAKYYFENDYMVNYNIQFENFSKDEKSRWMFLLKTDDDEDFNIIDKDIKHKNKSTQNKLINFFNKTNKRTLPPMKVDSILREIKSIFPNKIVVFIPISCRPLSIKDIFSSKINFTDRIASLPKKMFYYTDYYLFLLLINDLLSHGHSNFKTLKEINNVSIKTPASYKKIYTNFFTVYTNERTQLTLLQKYALYRLFDFYYSLLNQKEMDRIQFLKDAYDIKQIKKVNKTKQTKKSTKISKSSKSSKKTRKTRNI